MKKITFLMALLISSIAFSQNTVSVDGSKNHNAFVAAFNTSDSQFAFGFGYNSALSKITFNGNLDEVTLQPNFAIWADNIDKDGNGPDPGWFDAGNPPTPNKTVEVSSFVEEAPGGSLVGQDLTFSGDVDSFTIANGYKVEVFIKTLDPNNGFATITNNRVELTSGDTSFSVSATAAQLPSDLIIQYGYTVTGLIADPAMEGSLGSVVLSNPNATPPSLPSWTFDDASSITDFVGIADAAEPTDAAEAAFEPNGNPTGALSLTGVNPVQGAGRNYTWRYENANFNFLGNDEFTISFDAKFDGSFTAASFSVGAQIPNTTAGAGVKLVDNLNLEGQVNGSTWSKITLNISDPDFNGSNGLFLLDIRIGAGADKDSGGTILIDNLVFSGATASTNDNNLVVSQVLNNPTSSEWTIKTTNTNIKSVQVFNILGKQVYSAKLDRDQAVIPATNLNSGIYIARVQTDLGVKSIKLVRNFLRLYKPPPRCK